MTATKTSTDAVQVSGMCCDINGDCKCSNNYFHKFIQSIFLQNIDFTRPRSENNGNRSTQYLMLNYAVSHKISPHSCFEITFPPTIPPTIFKFLVFDHDIIWKTKIARNNQILSSGCHVTYILVLSTQ